MHVKTKGNGPYRYRYISPEWKPGEYQDVEEYLESLSHTQGLGTEKIMTGLRIMIAIDAGESRIVASDSTEYEVILDLIHEWGKPLKKLAQVLEGITLDESGAIQTITPEAAEQLQGLTAQYKI
jgi:thioredoxin-like negative regulator of GroEL